MKLAILDIKTKATIVALTALAEAGLTDGDKYYITDGAELNVYIYTKLAKAGDYQPDDAGGATGWWIKENRFIHSLFYAVADGYDFGGNAATEVSSIDNWGRAGEYLLTIAENQDEIDKLVVAKTFGSCTASEKIVASEWFVVDKSDRDTIHSSAVQEANADSFVGKLVSKLMSVNIERCRDAIKDADRTAILDEVASVDLGVSVIEIAGAGTKALHDDGTYKTVVGGNGGSVDIDATNYVTSGTGSTVFYVTGDERELNHEGNGTRAYHYQFIVPKSYTGAGSMNIPTKGDDVAGNSLTMSAYINGVVDTTIEAYDIEASIDDTWELKTVAFEDDLSPGDIISIRIDSISGVNDFNAWRNFYFDFD